MSNGLTVIEPQQHSTALSTNVQASEVAARAEIEGAIVIARRFPRNEETAFGSLIKACQRPTFAEDVSYAFPRGSGTVTGPSVYLAKEAARLWGNMRYGVDVVLEDEDQRHIRAWAWDVQTNTKVNQDVIFQKLIQRKQGGTTQWIKPDERDLRELTNKHGSIAVRNCILSLLPTDLIEDAVQTAARVLREKTSKDPEGERKRIIVAFAGINVSADDLAKYLHGPVGQATPDQIGKLRTIYKSICDGNSTWSEYLPKTQTPSGTVDALTNPQGQAEDRPVQKTAEPDSSKTDANHSETPKSSARVLTVEDIENDFGLCTKMPDVLATQKRLEAEAAGEPEKLNVIRIKADERMAELQAKKGK